MGPVLLTEVTLALGVICNVVAPRRSLNSSLYQQETSRVILEETKFISDESRATIIAKANCIRIAADESFILQRPDFE